MSGNMGYFLPGLIGALAPEVLRLYTLRQSKVQLQGWYYAISAIYALLGGYVATIIPLANSAWLAFAVGVALPNVINFATKLIVQLTAGGGAGAPSGDESFAPAQRGGLAPVPESGVARKGTFRDFVKAL